MYKSKEEKPVLLSLSESYSELNAISVDASRYSFYSISHCLLTTYTTNYCPSENINSFDLRKLFYSKQCFKSYYYSLI